MVVSTGFSQSSSSLTEVDYGIVLRNTSPDRDARDVQVTVNALDAKNVVLDSAVDTVLTIPAGSTYYFGGQSHYPGTAVTARLDVFAQVGESVAVAGALPAAANVRIEPSSLGGVEVLGEVRNTAGLPLSSLARITAVLYDGQGKVVGGGYAYPESDVPPGARIGFEVFVRSVPSSVAASAQVSIEPEYDAASPSSALVTVLKQGSSETSSSSTRELDYGVVLRNVSPDRDARSVHVTVNAIDAHNVVIRSASTWLAGIPADSTYYFGGWLFHSTAQATTGLEVFVQADGSAAKALVQAVPGNVRIQPVLGGVRVLGDVTNAAAAPLSSLASITAVIFDAGGNVVGGGLTLPESDAPPGARVGFMIYAFSVPVGQAASAQVSVEPNYH
ncbi:MAG: FxLYD domain-containing protein [Gaiellaceae bacterium]